MTSISTDAVIERVARDAELRSHYMKSLREEWAASAKKRERSPPPPPRRMPPIPDMRFEPSYLKSIAPYVKVERQVVEAQEEEGKEEAALRMATREVIRIQWGRVCWVTVRDQVISLLLQGVLRGLAGVFLSPLLSSVGASFRAWWTRGATRSDEAHIEGHGVEWLRNWMASLTAGSAVAGAAHSGALLK